MSDTLELRQPVDPDDEGLHTPPPPFEGVKWRIKVGEKEYGPYPRSRLIDFLKEGRVQAGTFIACGTDIDYHRADHHPNLRWDFKAPRKRKFGDPRLEPGETEVPVCNYFIAGRLMAGNERFERVLRDAGKMTRVAGDMWVLRSKQTVQQLRNQLTIIMKPHEHFVIVNATKDRLAWFNIGVEQDISVRGVWDSDEIQ
ncbi:MAG TPA: hypothetical protein VG942_01670 [Hyphomonadaceae bacterium]|nr:hypothetical protein [Hyphomonadaceae bacterium]